jgi:hypothetical protein
MEDNYRRELDTLHEEIAVLQDRMKKLDAARWAPEAATGRGMAGQGGVMQSFSAYSSMCSLSLSCCVGKCKASCKAPAYKPSEACSCVKRSGVLNR